jgi:BirA family biotin operon repressor/biotin-[acetyl-CoA-carboxylase] ligase
MIELTPLQLELITRLNDTTPHTDIALSQLLKKSLSIVKKELKTLQTLGLPIIITPKEGYTFPYPLTILSKNAIEKHVKDLNFSPFLNIHVFASIDSTNQFLKKHTEDANIQLCCAEIQTRGRGRFARPWISSPFENIALSLRFQLPCDVSQLSGLSLVAGLSVLKALKKWHVDEDIQIKWPNDILWRGKKLCGILIELHPTSKGDIQTIIGIGLNVNEDTQKHKLKDKLWCSLYEITQKRLDRNALIAEIVVELNTHIQLFLEQGLPAFIPSLQKVDSLANQFITIFQTNKNVEGIARGINEKGELLLEDKNGQLHALSSGEASLHGV